MSHNVRSPHARGVRPWHLAITIASVLALLISGSARADVVRCKREIAKASAKFAQAKMRALQKCQDGKLTGKVSAACPDANTTAMITKAVGKLRSALDKKCGGADHDCTTSNDNDPIAALGWGSTCPNFEGGSCTNTINDCAGISNCLLCVDEAAVDQGIDLYYGNLVNSSNPNVKKCQREIGKNAVKYLRTKSKLLQKCQDKMLSGAIPGPCPDAKTASALTTADAKKNAKI
jgi:hypothetical protein